MELQKFVFKNKPFALYIRDEADRSVVAEIFSLREYRSVEDLIANAETCVIDVGAHRGYFTLYARALNANVPIIAFEPEKENIVAFKEHMKKNGAKNVVLLEGALAGSQGTAKLVVTKDSHNHHVLTGAPGKYDIVESVSAFSLARVLGDMGIATVDLIKLDIEGGEYDVFTSMEEATFNKLQSIVLEYHNTRTHTVRDIELVLRENGFSVQIFPSHFDASMGFLVAKNKRSARNQKV